MEEDDRLEEKVDAILKHLNERDGERLIAELDRKYPGCDTGPQPEEPHARGRSESSPGTLGNS